MSKSAEEGLPLPAANEPSEVAPSHSKKTKMVFAVLLIVGVVAAVGVCAAVFAPADKGQMPADNEGDRVQPNEYGDLEARHSKMLKHVARSAKNRQGSRGRSHHPHQDHVKEPCISEESNDTIPAAHIEGAEYEWSTTAPPPALSTPSSTDIPGYQTEWTCQGDRGNAFVDGGMIFNHTDKALHVPKCGYYYVSSQVNFQVDANVELDQNFIAHQLHVHRNCTGDARDFKVVGYSPVGDGSYSVGGATFVGEIVKICAGGKIWIQIPDHVPCCPRGRPPYATFLGAYLVAETHCRWPLFTS